MLFCVHLADWRARTCLSLSPQPSCAHSSWGGSGGLGHVNVVRGPLWRCQPSPMVGALFSGELAALRGGEVAAQPVDQQDPGVSTAGPTGTVRAPLALVSLQASLNRMTHQGRDSPKHSGDALHVGWPWGILWVRGRKEEGLGSFPRKGWARGLYSSLSPVSVPMPRTRRCRGSRQLAGGPSGGRSQSPRWVPR